jgi:hypothetical protein
MEAKKGGRMKGIANLAMIVAAISLLLGVVARLAGINMPLAKGGVQPATFLVFTSVCLLFAITLILSDSAHKK